MTISDRAPGAPLPTTLHIGMPKAGSSTIQGVLQAAREALAARGILYPRDLLPNGSTGGTTRNASPSATRARRAISCSASTGSRPRKTARDSTSA